MNIHRVQFLHLMLVRAKPSPYPTAEAARKWQETRNIFGGCY